MGEAQENPPLKGVPERQRGWGMLVRLLDTLSGNPINIPLQRFAFATRCCPPRKGEFSVSPHYPIYFVKQHKFSLWGRNQAEWV